MAGRRMAIRHIGDGHCVAEDKMKLAFGQRGNWDTAVSELGQRAGIFKNNGLDLDFCGRKAPAKASRP